VVVGSRDPAVEGCAWLAADSQLAAEEPCRLIALRIRDLSVSACPIPVVQSLAYARSRSMGLSTMAVILHPLLPPLARRRATAVVAVPAGAARHAGGASCGATVDHTVPPRRLDSARARRELPWRGAHIVIHKYTWRLLNDFFDVVHRTARGRLGCRSCFELCGCRRGRLDKSCILRSPNVVHPSSVAIMPALPPQDVSPHLCRCPRAPQPPPLLQLHSPSLPGPLLSLPARLPGSMRLHTWVPIKWARQVRRWVGTRQVLDRV
jgi:hypothetical protein